MKDKSEEVQTPESDDLQQEIAEVAYSYWESRGREDGHDVEDWLAAEQEIMRRRSVQSDRRRRQANAA